MNLFLVTCVYKDGLSERSFRVVRASSEEDIAEHMIRDYSSWEVFIENAIFPIWLPAAPAPEATPEPTPEQRKVPAQKDA